MTIAGQSLMCISTIYHLMVFVIEVDTIVVRLINNFVVVNMIDGVGVHFVT